MLKFLEFSFDVQKDKGYSRKEGYGEYPCELEEEA